MATAAGNTQQQLYDAVAALTRCLDRHSKPTTRELKVKLSLEGYNALRSKLNVARPLL